MGIVAKPAMVRYSSPNYWQGRNGLTPYAIVLHIAGGNGSIISLTNAFASPAHEASAHFAIGKDGQIRQFVDTNDTAWSNGLSWEGNHWINPEDVRVNPSWKLIKPPINPNLVTISIEHEGKPGETWTDAMLQADIALIAYLCSMYPSIKPDRQHIIGHYELDPIDRPFCPGSKCPFSLIVSGVASKLHAAGSMQSVTKQTVADVWAVKTMYEAAMRYAMLLLKAKSSDPNAQQIMDEIVLGFDEAVTYSARQKPGTLADALSNTQQLEKVMTYARTMLDYDSSDASTLDRMKRARRLLGLTMRGQWVIRPNGTVILDRAALLEQPETGE